MYISLIDLQFDQNKDSQYNKESIFSTLEEKQLHPRYLCGGYLQYDGYGTPNDDGLAVS